MKRQDRTKLLTIDSAQVLLEMAEDEVQSAEALWFAKRAKKIQPDNFEAELMIARLTAEDDVVLLRKVENLVDKADRWMEEKGLMATEKFGNYWTIPETRPYVRLRLEYCRLMLQMGIVGRAVAEAEELMWLCEQDGPGIRYVLMALYALQGEEEKVKDLCEQYGEESLYVMIVLAILRFRKGDLKGAQSCLAKIHKHLIDGNSEEVELWPEINLLLKCTPGFYRWSCYVQKALNRKGNKRKDPVPEEAPRNEAS